MVWLCCVVYGIRNLVMLGIVIVYMITTHSESLYLNRSSVPFEFHNWDDLYYLGPNACISMCWKVDYFACLVQLM